MKKLKFTRYADGGHSWLKVPRKMIRELEIEEKISRCSYQFGEFAYLEEDCDMAIFLKALLNVTDLSYEIIKESVDIETKYSDKQSKIRSYTNFIPNFKRVEWEEGKKVKLYNKEYTMRLINGVKILNDGFRNYSIKASQLDDIFPVDTPSQFL